MFLHVKELTLRQEKQEEDLWERKQNTFRKQKVEKKYGVMASVKQQHFGNLAPTYFCNEVSFHVLKIFLLFSLLLFFTISSFCICYIAFSVICSRSLSVFLF